MTEEELWELYTNGSIGEKTYRRALFSIKANKKVTIIKTSDLKDAKIENDNQIVFDEFVKE